MTKLNQIIQEINNTKIKVNLAFKWTKLAVKNKLDVNLIDFENYLSIPQELKGKSA